MGLLDTIGQLFRRVARPLATGRQRAYARRLGIHYPLMIGKAEMSALISQQLGSQGVSTTREHLREVEAFVWSVIRDKAKAKWRFYRQSGIDPESVATVAKRVCEDDALCQSLDGQFSNGYNGECGDDPNREEDVWVLFGEGHASRRSKAYREIVAMMNIRFE